MALKKVTFSIEEGEFVSIVGPSGCGKSTILNIIAGIISCSSGEIAVLGRSIHGILPEIGYLFQKDVLLPWKTVRENIALSMIFRGINKETAYKTIQGWIEKVGLKGFEDYYPVKLSGGMRRRVALAMTFVYNPQIILMDEPFSALDIQTRNMMENELLELWAETRKTVLFVTHDIEEAISLSDRVLVLTRNPGSIKSEYEVELGRPRNVTEVRFEKTFSEVYERIWEDLKEEVILSYEESKRK
ncbi:MAG: ABC transporter ATP-binding protein [Desulfobacteraceae bacterium]